MCKSLFVVIIKQIVPELKCGSLTIGNTRVSVAYYYFYDNIQLYEPLGKALLFTSIS